MSFLVIASNIVMALFMAAVSEYVSYDLLVGDTAMVTVHHLAAFQVGGHRPPHHSHIFQPRGMCSEAQAVHRPLFCAWARWE